MERPSLLVSSRAGSVSPGEGGIAPRADRRRGRIRLLRWLGYGFHAVTALVAAAILLLLIALLEVLTHGAWLSIRQFGWSFLTGSNWDAFHSSYAAGPAIAGTLITSALALVIAVPIAIGAAVFLSEIAPTWLRRPLVYVVDLGAAVPSVVYGFWAFMVLGPLMRSTVEPGLSSLTGGGYPFGTPSLGQDIFVATLVLAAMIVPTIAAVSRESLRAVPRAHRESALSLGATRWEATRLGVLGPARDGIVAGIILGLGRALGETVAVAMVIGNVYFLPGTLFSPGATLATTILNNFPGDPGLNRSAIVELALILLAITVVVNVVARGLLARWTRREGGERTRWTRKRTRTMRSGLDPDRPGRQGPSGARDGSLPVALAVTSDWRDRAARAAPRRLSRRRAIQWVIVGLTGACVVLALVPFASLIVTSIQNGGSAVIQPSFYTSPPPIGCNPRPGAHCSLGGIGPQIAGTLVILAVGALIAVPVGILAGIYLSEYGRNRFGRTVSFLSDVMTGVPTIVIAVFVFGLFLVVAHDVTLSALACGAGLGVLMIPIATRTTEQALRAVPASLRESALALGFPRHRVALRVVLGNARGGIVTGMLLAASRAIGDTAIPLLLGGSLLVASASTWFRGLTQPVAVLTPFIFNNFSSPYQNLQTDAWGAVLVLLAIMLTVSLVTRLAVPGAGEAAEEG